MSGPLAWLKRREGARLALLGLAMAAVLFVCVNVIAGIALRGAQLDLTEGRLFTLADGTRETLAGLDEPIDLRLYFSRSLGELSPPYAAYHERVKELLDRYVELSAGNLRVQVLDPVPFSDAEDRAVADGLQGVPLTQAGDQGYFGVAGVNQTDGHAVIPFLNLDRERFVEYDLTKLIHGLATPDKPVLGVISALPPERDPGGMPTRPPSLTLLDQLGEFFQVETLEPDVDAIPETVQALFVINLDGIALPALRAVDRFVHAGRPALVLADPVLETMPGHGPIAAEPAPPADVAALLAAWGVAIAADKVAGDLDAARRVATGHGGAGSDYVAWLSLSAANMDADDPVMASVERLNLATAGIIQPVEGRTTTVAPLVTTGLRAAGIDAASVRFNPDVPGILRRFKAEGQPLTLAARISGPARAAFPAEARPDARPDAAPDAALDAKAPINLILVSDADFVYDQFWVNRGSFFGEQVVVPVANNADFVINAIENLAGSASLAGLRGRGSSYRPFTLVDSIRMDAEQQFRAKEQALQEQLRDLQQRLDQVQKERGQGGQVILSSEDQQAIERFRGEILAVRKQLRDVQLALRQDIENLEGVAKFLNIAAVPLVIAVIGVIVVVVHRLRRRRAVLRPA
jgi:ABC-type uncharacterized transport system involved in gliding motility auxiliary subunit